MSIARCVLDAQAGIGESPVWCAEEDALYWVDILAPALHRIDHRTGATRTWRMPEAIGSFGLREQGGAVVALRSGLYLFDFEHEELTSIAPDPEGDCPATRFNDGKVSPDGRFWVGTMDDESFDRPLAALYRLDPDHSLYRQRGDLKISNGLAWSADGRTLYHADTSAGTIERYEYDPLTGAAFNRRPFVSVDVATGLPDGGATDVEGYYWSAGVTAGVLNRWSPDGELDRQIALPCARPTCPCFGGPDMKTLFVTSLRAGLSEQELEASPRSGGLFAIDVDVAGVPVGRFRG